MKYLLKLPAGIEFFKGQFVADGSVQYFGDIVFAAKGIGSAGKHRRNEVDINCLCRKSYGRRLLLLIDGNTGDLIKICIVCLEYKGIGIFAQVIWLYDCSWDDV